MVVSESIVFGRLVGASEQSRGLKRVIQRGSQQAQAAIDSLLPCWRGMNWKTRATDLLPDAVYGAMICPSGWR